MIRFIISISFIFCSFAVYAEMGAKELDRADALFRSLELSDNITFIRNNKAHDGKEAASHLRLKLRRGKGKVDSLEEFIVEIGSHSFISGKPYLIKLEDNKTILAKDYLLGLIKGP